MKVTIRKIADIAGVSRGAVDKVIHDRPGVKDSVRKRVLEVIEETGYVPLHTAARKLETEKTVAVIMPRLNNPYFCMLQQGMVRMNKAMPEIRMEYYYCDSTNINEITAVLDFLEERNVDLYLIRGAKSATLKDRINLLKQPVMFIDSIVPGTQYLCCIGEDCYQGGRVIASLLAKTIGKKGEIAVIAGSPEIIGHKQRLDGFLEAMQEHAPAVRIVEQVYSQDQSIIAYERTSKILEKYPKLCGIGNLAGYAGEIGQAILDHHRRGRVKLVCYDVSENVTALVKQGIIEFSINLFPERQGQIIMETIYDYLIQHKIFQGGLIRTPFSIVLDETVRMFDEG